MIKYICKLSSTDLFCKNGYQTVNLWNSTMFKSTFWTKRKQQLLTIPHFFQDEALDLFYISLMVFYADCKVRRSGYPDRWTRYRDACLENESMGCKQSIIRIYA